MEVTLYDALGCVVPTQNNRLAQRYDLSDSLFVVRNTTPKTVLTLLEDKQIYHILCLQYNGLPRTKKPDFMQCKAILFAKETPRIDSNSLQGIIAGQDYVQKEHIDSKPINVLTTGNSLVLATLNKIGEYTLHPHDQDEYVHIIGGKGEFLVEVSQGIVQRMPYDASNGQLSVTVPRKVLHGVNVIEPTTLLSIMGNFSQIKQ